MADSVQSTLETLVPEMDVLYQKEYFTKLDIKKIMKKRRFYEYQFEKKDVSYLDYFKAIKYEKILNKRMKNKKKLLKIKKNDFYDYHFVRRIIILFQKCLIKFPLEKIYLEFFNFLLENENTNILNNELGKCLTKFPTNILFWKFAAYFEYEKKNNFHNARNLFQKYVKLNQNDIDGYLEYFVFEIIFAKNLAERHKILLKKDENKKNESKNEKIEENDDDITKLKIPEIIYDDAINKFKDKNQLIKINLQFLEKLEKYATESKILDYKILESKIIENIINIDGNIFTLIKIVNIKINKFDKLNDKQKLEEISEEYNKLLYLDKYKEYYNFISFNLINLFKESEVLEDVFNLIKDKMDLKTAFSNYDKNNNIQILIILTELGNTIENILQVQKLDSKKFINNTFNIYKKIFESKNIEKIKEIFIIISNIKNNSFFNIDNDYLLKNLFCVNFVKDNNKDLINFLNFFNEILINMFSEDFTFYLHPDIMPVVFNQIISLNKKCHLSVIKNLFYKLIDILLEKLLQLYENEENLGNIESIKYFIEAFDLLKDKSKQNLINITQIKNEIINRKKYDSEKLNSINWLNSL